MKWAAIVIFAHSLKSIDGNDHEIKRSYLLYVPITFLCDKYIYCWLDNIYADFIHPHYVTSGARRAERVLWFCERNLSMCGPTQPDPTQPDPVTLLRSLYLWNGLTDSRTVFFVRCYHSINFVFDQHRYPPVPATARGTCRGEGVGDALSIGNSTTAGPIAFKFGVCLETS